MWDNKRVLLTVRLGCLLGQKRQPVLMHHSQLSDFALTTRPYSMASNVTDGETKAQTLPYVITDGIEE